MQRLNLNKLSATEFEDFSFHLLCRLGFVNVDWRKGTPLPSSPADRGRDIVCQHPREDLDSAQHFETWFVDCKRFKKAVPPTELQNALAWAEAESPSVLLFVLSGFLSNPAKDYLETYSRKHRPSFRIKYWERPQLEQIAGRKRVLLMEFGLLKERMRSTKELRQAQEHCFEKLAHFKFLQMKYPKRKPGTTEIFGIGALRGRIDALDWVLGSEWDDGLVSS